MPMTHAEAQAVLNYTMKNTAYSPAKAGYLALFTVPVTANDTAPTECTYTGYARVAITWADTDTGGNTMKNSATVTFAANTATTQTVVAIGIFDAVSSGSLKYYENICPRITTPGDTPISFPIGGVVIRLGPP